MTRDVVRLDIFYSPFLFIPATAIYLLVSGWVLFWLYAALISDNILVIISGATVAVVGVPLLLSYLKPIIHSWTHKGPVVTFDLNGVRDVRKKHAFIPWSDIGRVTLGSGHTAGILCFEFHRADRTREDPPRLGALGTLLRRTRFLSDWNVNLRLLSCGSSATLSSAERFQQRAIRKDVVLRNRKETSGWSGTL
jgi:hypothetical protein